MEDLPKTDEEWRKKLDENTYRITRQHGTERAFTGRYWDCKQAGTYRCVCCGAALFDSTAKYDSGSGWPSFWRALDAAPLGTRADHSLSMERTELHCERCGAHLGHVFDDGPPPSGLRFCINSASLQLEADTDGTAE